MALRRGWGRGMMVNVTCYKAVLFIWNILQILKETHAS